MSKSYEELLQSNLNFFKQSLEEQKIINTSTNEIVTIDYNTVQGKVLYAFLNTLTNASYNNDINSEFLLKQFFPQTADYTPLKEFHGNTWGVYHYTSTPATGYIIFTGIEGGSIMQGTQISSNGNNYLTQETVVISKSTIQVKSLTSSQGKATVVLSQDFKTASGMPISRIYGANEEQYNKENFKITTISTNSFTYDIDTDAPNTATGDIFVDIISASVLVESSDTGSNQNLIAGSTLKMNVEQQGVDSTCYVYYDGINGGKDEEEMEDYRKRILERIRGIPQGWNRSNIILKIREFQYGKYTNALIFIPRAEKTDGTIVSGYTTIYMIKNDFTTLSNTELQDIKQYLVDTIYKINPTEDQVNVVNPVLREIEINVSLLNEANTLDMKKAVEETIKEMQNDQNVCYFRKKIFKKTIQYWLDQVIDSNGNILEDNYILNNPEDDIELQYNEFPILKITWE